MLSEFEGDKCVPGSASYQLHKQHVLLKRALGR